MERHRAQVDRAWSVHLQRNSNDSATSVTGLIDSPHKIIFQACHHGRFPSSSKEVGTVGWLDPAERSGGSTHGTLATFGDQTRPRQGQQRSSSEIDGAQ